MRGTFIIYIFTLCKLHIHCRRLYTRKLPVGLQLEPYGMYMRHNISIIVTEKTPHYCVSGTIMDPVLKHLDFHTA